jgi:hypothetical protein
LRAKTCGVVHGPEPDDFAVAVGEGVLRLGHLAAGAGLVEHAHYLVVEEASRAYTYQNAIHPLIDQSLVGTMKDQSGAITT